MAEFGASEKEKIGSINVKPIRNEDSCLIHHYILASVSSFRAENLQSAKKSKKVFENNFEKNENSKYINANNSSIYDKKSSPYDTIRPKHCSWYAAA